MTARPRWLLVGLLGLVWCAPPAGAPPPPPPQKYALLIGLDSQRYEGVQLQGLKYATADVDALEDILSQDAFGFKVTPLRDVGAKREDIVAELRRFSRVVNPQDDFLLYFAGHGVLDTNGQTYWVTYDTNLAELDVHGIRLSHLLEFVREIPAQRKLIILDHCYSGEIIARLAGETTATLAEDPGRAAPGGAREPGIPVSAERSLVPRDLTEVVDNVLKTKGAGLAVLAASRGAAYELDQPIGHGLFTSVLVQALTTPDADTLSAGQPQGDRQLSVRELAGFVATQIRKKSEDLKLPQEPLESLQGQDLDRWFLGNLPAGTSSQLAKHALYRSTVATWRQREWISQTTALYCYTMLSNWKEAVQAGTPVGPEIGPVLRALEDATNTAFPEKPRADLLEETIQKLSPGGTP